MRIVRQLQWWLQALSDAGDVRRSCCHGCVHGSVAEQVLAATQHYWGTSRAMIWRHIVTSVGCAPRTIDTSPIFSLFFVSFLFVPCGRLSWLPVSFVLKIVLSYRIISLLHSSLTGTCRKRPFFVVETCDMPCNIRPTRHCCPCGRGFRPQFQNKHNVACSFEKYCVTCTWHMKYISQQRDTDNWSYKQYSYSHNNEKQAYA